MPEPEVVTPDSQSQQDAEALLAAAKSESERAEAELRQAQEQSVKLKQERESLEFNGHLGRAVAASGIKFHLEKGELGRLLRREPGLDIGVDGVCFLDGHKCSLEAALKVFADRHQGLVEKSKADYQRAELERRSKVTSRDQLQTVAQKTAYIRQHGSEAFAALPQHSTPDIDPSMMSTDELLRLPASDKCRIISRVGSDNWGRMIERSKQLGKH